MKVVQEVLGHANFETTANIYTGAFESAHKDAAAALDAMYTAAVGSRPAPDAEVIELW
jgi:site-specific recombinase XerC